MYKTTFARTGNYLTLQDQHIIVHKNSTDKEEKIVLDVELGQSNHHNTDDDNSSIYLAIEIERRHWNNKQQSGELKDDDDTYSNADYNDDNDEQLLEQREIHNTRNTKKQPQFISGTCVICFEDFQTNDVIVWSNNPTCPHVYHHDCMVHCLASHAERNNNNTGPRDGRGRATLLLDVTQNPCPTCRQNFCHVQDPDIIALLLHKTTAAVVTRTTTTIAAPIITATPLPVAAAPSVAVGTPARAE